MLTNSIDVIYSDTTNRWLITGKRYDSSNPVIQTTYGTERLNGYQLLEHCLNLHVTRVYDSPQLPDGTSKRTLNKKETLLAATKQDAIKQAFQDWIFSDITRRQEICEKYNALFNTQRTKEYNGSHLQFPGISSNIKLYPHQVNAVARIL